MKYVWSKFLEFIITKMLLQSFYSINLMLILIYLQQLFNLIYYKNTNCKQAQYTLEKWKQKSKRVECQTISKYKNRLRPTIKQNKNSIEMVTKKTWIEKKEKVLQWKFSYDAGHKKGQSMIKGSNGR